MDLKEAKALLDRMFDAVLKEEEERRNEVEEMLYVEQFSYRADAG